MRGEGEREGRGRRGLFAPLSRSKDLDCLSVLSDNLFSVYVACNLSASMLRLLLLSPFDSISQLREGVMRVSQAEKYQMEHVCMHIYVPEEERSKVIISSGKTSTGQETASARAAYGREQAALAWPGPCRAFQYAAWPSCVVLIMCDSAELLPWWRFAVCL